MSSGIEIYTGEGKGKSTSALGKALQAIGRGISQDKSHRVLILQWLKGGSGYTCLLYTSPSPRDRLLSRMPSSA